MARKHRCPKCNKPMVKVTSPINLGWVCVSCRAESKDINTYGATPQQIRNIINARTGLT